MRFKYKARTKEGKIIKGEAEAPDKFALARRMRGEQKFLISAGEIDTKKALSTFLSSFLGSVRLRDRIVFARNMSAMLEAGLPLVRSLSVLERQTKNKRFKQVLGSLSQEIIKGGTLYKAMSVFPHVFSPLSIAMVKAGEEGGTLPGSLKTIGDHLEQIHLLQRRIRGALMYPGVIVIAMVIIGILMLVYVVPTLAGTFKDLGVSLPLSTQIIIFISDFLRTNTFLFLALLAALGVLLFLAARSRTGKRVFEFTLLRMPLIGALVKKENSARTCRTLSSLLVSGVPMVEALSITKEVVQNSYYKKILEEAETKIPKGVSLSKVFSQNENLYPVLVGEMTAVGEETGKLSEMLMKTALFYEEEVGQATKDLSTIVEPILMIVIGAAVGFFAFSMITPLYSVLGGI